MNWGIVASFAAVAVTAVLGALGIAREQSAIRQLERVTAVLKDSEPTFQGRAELEWMRAALAKRVNNQYRAPRARGNLFWSWVSLLLGWGLLAGIYGIFVKALTDAATATNDGKVEGWGAWVVLSIGIITGVGGAMTGARGLRARQALRDKWIKQARAEDSDAPTL